MMFTKETDRWILLVHCPSGRIVEVDRWLREYAPTEVTHGKGPAPTVLRAVFKETVVGWSGILERVTTRRLEIAPTGLASLFYEDDDLGIALLLYVMRNGAVPVHDRPSLGGEDANRLTLSQYEVISLAVGLGYYDATPRADQHAIAVHLGVTAAQVSELLLRGEANIVTSYVDSAMMANTHEDGFGDALDREDERSLRAGAPTPTRAGGAEDQAADAERRGKGNPWRLSSSRLV